jgi:hypothetical protein
MIHGTDFLRPQSFFNLILALERCALIPSPDSLQQTRCLQSIIFNCVDVVLLFSDRHRQREKAEMDVGNFGN